MKPSIRRQEQVRSLVQREPMGWLGGSAGPTSPDFSVGLVQDPDVFRMPWVFFFFGIDMR